MVQPIIEVRGITKNFGAVTALDDVNLKAYRGEVLALVGDNGAGKSTLIKIMSGVYTYDKGEIFFNGKPIRFQSPHDARELGIETVYQDLSLEDNLDVAANMFLGRESYRLFLKLIKILDFYHMERQSQKVLKNLQIEIESVRSKVENLSGGQKQAVAIARALLWDAKLTIMDEPTAALGVSESNKVLDIISGLKRKDICVIIISQNMQHVFAVADRFVVLRRGKVVGELLRDVTSIDQVVKLIVGGEEDSVHPRPHGSH